MKLRKIGSLLIGCLISMTSFGQSLEEQAQSKMSTLESLIAKAEKENLNVEKEKMMLHTASIFLEYANVDEDNTWANTKHYELHPIYKDSANAMAKALPEFERQDVNEMLDVALSDIQKVLNKSIIRPNHTSIDYSKVSFEGTHVAQNGKPVYLADYIWKADDERLTKYYGDFDGEYLSPAFITEDLNYQSWAYSSIENHAEDEIGMVFIDNDNIPSWAFQKYDNFSTGARHYGKYDIDHPGARELYGKMYEHFVPLMKGKNYTKMGYMLFNEPSFFTAKDVWNTGEVSAYTKEKFNQWLAIKHESITVLNSLWGTNYTDFESIEIEIPMDQAKQGTPIWYDWMSFNNERVTDWFAWSKAEIQKYDAEASVHIKLMPWLWSQNARDHGMDFEALLNVGDIIGCDVAARYSYRWGNPEWTKNYAFDWRETSMTFDFFKSVQPDQMIYDTENHFLIATQFAVKKIDPAYINAIFWLGHTHGMGSTTTWVWSRKADGKIDESRPEDESYIVDLSHQPRALAQVTSTLMDINDQGEFVYQLQNADKPLRVFYSQTSALNHPTYMDELYHAYEKLYFEGISIGFATEGIINAKRDTWEVIVVSNTEYVTIEELNALQSFIDEGGKVIVDAVSLKKDQYGNPHTKTLSGASTFASLEQLAQTATAQLSPSALPNITLTEKNANNAKACVWKTVEDVDGSQIVSIINIGNKAATLSLNLPNAQHDTQITDLLTGKILPTNFVMQPNQVYLLKVKDALTNAPKLGFINMEEGDSFPLQGLKKVEVSASIPEGNISWVQLYLNNELIGELTEAPYLWEDERFQALEVGTHELRVKAMSSTLVEAELSLEFFIACEDINTEVNQEGNVLKALQTNVNYQWIDCDTDLPIEGETAATFKAKKNGSYAVILDNGSCQERSDCYEVQITNSENTLQKHFSIYPNPANDRLTLRFPTLQKNCQLLISHLNGTQVFEKNYSSLLEVTLNIETLITGMYLIQIKSDENIYIERFIKQ